MSNRHINFDGLRLIKKFEGFKLKSYRDIKGILTIGFGHTGSDVTENQVITEVEALQLLRSDLSVSELAVSSSVTVELTDNQFSACVSLCFNIGQGHFKSSTLVKKLNQGLYLVAADCFLDWCKANGQVVPGLLTRRQAERKLFLEGVS